MNVIETVRKCNLCLEEEENGHGLIGLGANDNNILGYKQVNIGDTDCHICVDCISELGAFFNSYKKLTKGE